MPRAKTRTSVKRGRWASYNTFRAANRELDRRRRLEKAAEKRARGEAALLSQAEAVARRPQAKVKHRPALRMRVAVEIVGHGKHQFTADYCPVFRRWSVPERRILAGLAALMQRAPVIAGILPES